MQHGYLEPLALMDFKVLPESLNTMANEKFAREPVGSGPFHFIGRGIGPDKVDKCVFASNPYFGARANREGLPRIREIHLVKPEDPARDFRDERLGLLLDPTTAKFKELKAMDSLRNIVSFKTLPNRAFISWQSTIATAFSRTKLFARAWLMRSNARKS